MQIFNGIKLHFCLHSYVIRVLNLWIYFIGSTLTTDENNFGPLHFFGLSNCNFILVIVIALPLWSCRYLSHLQAIAKITKNKLLSPIRSEKMTIDIAINYNDRYQDKGK